MQEPQDQQHRHPSHVGTPGWDGSVVGLTGGCMTMLTPSSMAKIVMNFPSASTDVTSHDPPVRPREVTVGRGVPAGEAGKREQLDVDREHAEHAYPPQHVERLDPHPPLGPRRLPRAILPATASRAASGTRRDTRPMRLQHHLDVLPTSLVIDQWAITRRIQDERIAPSGGRSGQSTHRDRADLVRRSTHARVRSVT